MHPIGQLADPRVAEKIIQELEANSITTKLTQEDDILCIWVEREEDIEFAIERYRVALGFGKPIEVDPEWAKIGGIPMGQLSLCFILISVGLYICQSWLPETRPYVSEFFISLEKDQLFAEIRGGQIWRLLTPIFLHFNFIHILFNMMWLKDLGSLIEKTDGQKYFLFFVLVSGIFSNIGQYMVSGPNFGGMSGVIYALLGLIWMRNKFDEEFDYGLPKRDMILMIGFFIACMTGFLGPIANTAHALGLTIGMLVGILPGLKKQPSQALFFAGLALAFSVLALGVDWWKLKGQFYFLIF